MNRGSNNEQRTLCIACHFSSVSLHKLWTFWFEFRLAAWIHSLLPCAINKFNNNKHIHYVNWKCSYCTPPFLFVFSFCVRLLPVYVEKKNLHYQKKNKKTLECKLDEKCGWNILFGCWHLSCFSWLMDVVEYITCTEWRPTTTIHIMVSFRGIKFCAPRCSHYFFFPHWKIQSEYAHLNKNSQWNCLIRIT